MLGPEQINLGVRNVPIFLEGQVSINVSETTARQLALKDNQIVRGVIESQSGKLQLVIDDKSIPLAKLGRLQLGDTVALRAIVKPDGLTLVPINAFPKAPKTVPEYSDRFLRLLYSPNVPGLGLKGLQPATLNMLASLAGSASGVFLASMSNISRDTVKSAFLNSGLFTELNLLSKERFRPDLKTMLRTLLALNVIRTNASLVSDINSAVDLIESKQLDSLAAQLNRETLYSFILPFKDFSPVEVDIEKYSNISGGQGASWIINLFSSSDELGDMWLKTTLLPQQELDVMIWAERTNTAQCASAAMSELTHQLKSFGLSLSGVQVFNSVRPAPDRDLSTPGHMVNAKA